MPSAKDFVIFRRGKGRMRHCLYPVDDRARESLAKTPPGSEVGVRISHDRSLPMHNRFFKVLDVVARATHWETPERLLVGLKIRLGRYDVCQLPNGQRVPVPQSISFAAMGQVEFERFQQDAFHVLQTEVVPGLDIDQIAIEAGVPGSPRSPTQLPSPHKPRGAGESELTRQLKASLALLDEEDHREG